jgi:hypothetical protein
LPQIIISAGAVEIPGFPRTKFHLVSAKNAIRNVCCTGMLPFVGREQEYTQLLAWLAGRRCQEQAAVRVRKLKFNFVFDTPRLKFITF